MYQLEPFEKSKNIEVDKQNVVEYLSHVGLKLERMLAFINTQNKTDMKQTKGMAELVSNQSGIYKPSVNLGLNPKDASFDDSVDGDYMNNMQFEGEDPFRFADDNFLMG